MRLTESFIRKVINSALPSLNAESELDELQVLCVYIAEHSAFSYEAFIQNQPHHISLDRQYFLPIFRALISALHLKANSEQGADQAFLTELESAGLNTHEKVLVLREFDSPSPPRAIARLVCSNDIALLIYALSYQMLYEIHEAENYLDELSNCLDIPPKKLAALHETFSLNCFIPSRKSSAAA